MNRKIGKIPKLTKIGKFDKVKLDKVRIENWKIDFVEFGTFEIGIRIN